VQTDTFQNYHQPVNFNNSSVQEMPGGTPIGTPTQLIQNNDPRDKKQMFITKPDNVNDILKRLHSREDVDTVDTQDENTTNNDRLISDTMSDTSAKGKGKKKVNKKPLMSVL
jgi:hypothetical protein